MEPLTLSWDAVPGKAAGRPGGGRRESGCQKGWMGGDAGGVLLGTWARGSAALQLLPVWARSRGAAARARGILAHGLTCSCSRARSAAACTSCVLEMEAAGFASEGPLPGSSLFPGAAGASLLAAPRGFLTSLALSFEMGLSRS